MVLIKVDFPSPVWPKQQQILSIGIKAIKDNLRQPTDTNDIELKATLQELPLNLRGNAVKTDMGARVDGGLLLRIWGSSSSSHDERREVD